MSHHQSALRSEPVACPICGRFLKWMPDRWLAEFECEGCGAFSDFAGAAPLSEQRHHSPQAPLRHESPHTTSHGDEQDKDDKQDKKDEDDSGGTTA